MDANTAAVLIIAVLIFMAVLRKPKRSRYIPKKSRDLADAKFKQEFYANPENKGKRLPRRKHLEYDHYEPFADGGTHEPENIRLIAKRENRRKGRNNPKPAERIRAVLILAGILFLLWLFAKH